MSEPHGVDSSRKLGCGLAIGGLLMTGFGCALAVGCFFLEIADQTGSSPMTQYAGAALAVGLLLGLGGLLLVVMGLARGIMTGRREPRDHDSSRAKEE